MTDLSAENLPVDESLWTIKKVLRWSVNFLREKGSPSPQLDAELLLAHALRCKRIELYTCVDKPLSLDERSAYRDYIRRRAQGEPIAYINGFRGFWRHDFMVTKDVLVPRPETEVLLEIVVGVLKAMPEDPRRTVLDVGTGSGCLAISLAKELPNLDVHAWDISAPALWVAEKNAQTLHASVAFRKCDALDPQSWCLAQSFDVIMSNPPYIAQHELGLMDQSVLNFEPKLALFAAADGLHFYQVFAERAKQMLKPNGHLCVEVGVSQAEKVVEILREYGWQDISVAYDLAKIPRVVIAKVGGLQ